MAYLAGLFASDGCLLNNNRHLNLTNNDFEILEFTIKFLGLNVEVRQKKNGFGGVGNYIQFGDVALYDFLNNAGITPAKSKSIVKVDIPDGFYRDFLRGFFDGDGTVYSFWDRRWRSSLMYYTEFTSASLPFLEWLHQMNIESAGVNSGKIKNGIRALKLTYAKRDTQILYEFMYYANDLPALNRKKEKFTELLKSDPNNG